MTWTIFPTFLLACIGAGATGVLFPPGNWYLSLRKPGFTPPNRAFPIVWTVLYVLIAVAGTRLAGAAGGGFALALWALQMVLNTLWTPVFFGAHRIRAGMAIIAALWLTVLVSVVVFWRVDVLAALLFVPYLLWVSIAAALNARIWALNPERLVDAQVLRDAADAPKT